MLPVNTFQILHTYMNGIMLRAERQHARHVRDIVPGLIGCILWRAEPDSVSCRTYGSNTANVLWFSVGKKDYVLAYHANNGMVELHDRSSKRLLGSFENTSPLSPIVDLFKAL